MNGLFRTVMTLSLTACLLGSAFVGDAAAQKEKGKKKAGMAAGQQIFNLPKEITLTDEQKTKLEEIKKEHGPKLAELTKKMDDTLTISGRTPNCSVGRQSRVSSASAKKLISIMLRRVLGFVSPKSPVAPWPALFTKISSPPNC